MGVVPCTGATGASQLHTGRLSLLFLQVESLPQPKLQRVSTVRERAVEYMPNVSFHERNRARVSGVRHQEIALHLHHFLVT